ncbi:bifunctional diguanylate cyclase/phosphodiesterase [Ideonella sp. A 288]|uniref:putative bifunctional diguanylate cyclase/phosphodiesterase n=1 Tax=Ideonella sp. A 288 TaxID=1962181 RepID=UPI001185007C|nr:EAL domain-containing protein [Ideonella sp. A 288]
MTALFVLAAAVPTLLLAALAHQAVRQAEQAREVQTLSQSAKVAGLQVLDRLRMARQALVFESVQPFAKPSGGESPLRAVVSVSASGDVVLLRGAEDRRRLQALALAPAAQGLMVSPTAGGAPAVVVSHLDQASGRRWLGLVDPAFLWEDADDLPPDQWLCVVGPQREPLYCNDPGATTLALRHLAADPPVDGRPHAFEAPSRVDGQVMVHKPLFLDAHFKSADWHFMAGSTDGAAPAASGLLGSLMPLVALASLLSAGLLSLVQVRRTLQPLGRLADGARRMARQQFGTRVAVQSHDEFGELAEAFNDMAARLEWHFEETEALASIDRDIVALRALDIVLARVAQRAAKLLPGHAVVVGRSGPAETDPWPCQVVRPGVDSPQALAIAIEPSSRQRWMQAEGAWLDGEPERLALQDPVGLEPSVTLRLLGMSGGGRLYGFLAIAAPASVTVDGAALRHLEELRNRAVVAANAAHREQRLLHDARHDPLTDLLNRAGLREALVAAGAQAAASGRPLAVLYVDIDRFKAVNDSQGHAIGDQVLCEIARRLRRMVPNDAVLARPAGDEFVVVLPELAREGDARGVADSICRDLANAHRTSHWTVPLGASIGVALHVGGDLVVDDLLRHADQAMYEAKRLGKGRAVSFESQFDSAAQQRARIERELPLAIERNELRLLFQPRVDARSGVMESVEALVRWQHPTRGLCPPSEFISVAEDCGLIEPLGLWVIEAACAQLREWRDQGIHGLRVAVNLSAHQIESDRIEGDLVAALARHRLAPADLELEITESVFVGDSTPTVLRLDRLRRRGLVIALDDFGTGYSSMSYLRRLPVDILKIDRSFVTDLGRDPAARAVTHAIVALASSLGLRTVAEGVETETQRQALCDLGVDELQGYLFGRPLEPARVVALLEAASDAEAAIT